MPATSAATTRTQSGCCPRPKGRHESAEDLALLLKALGHPIRLHIVRFLLENKQCVFGDLAEHIGMAPSTVSQHVAVLREAGLLCPTPEGRAICYCVDRERLESAKKLLAAY